jgi:glutamyl-tRNA synthetase
MSPVVTRFAPSPTGFLHIGGARTALFNWLYARNQGGTFLLRIEDTDRERSTQAATDAILDSMRWLGLDWHGEPIFQSQRFDVYNTYIDLLLEQGHAYHCSCSPEAVEAMRERARAEGRKPKYDGSCRERTVAPGPGVVVRLKAPLHGRTLYQDVVKGPVSVDNAELDDMILRRSDGSPTYNLAVVVDDHEMGVTHVIRGDDHVANTPRQVLLYQAFGWDLPAFGHVPMILGPDKQKLSKRHGALSVMEYEKMGYLPEAMVNYLARLGWSHGDQEIFSRDELTKAFSPENLGRSAAVFDTQKLDWLNAHYIKESAPADLARLLVPLLEDLGFTGLDLKFLAALVPLYQTRAKTLAEMAASCAFFLVPAVSLEYDAQAVAKFLTEEARGHLKALRERLAGLAEFTAQAMEGMFGTYLEEAGLKFKAIAQPLRVAVTGKTASPGLFETLEVLGREESLARLDRAVAL